jgi:manganese/zinc/iron transport system permease protein
MGTMIWTDPTVVRILIGTLFISITAAVIGAFTFFQKKALIGDALSHAILPGIVLAYCATGIRETWILMLGALVAGMIANSAISTIQRKTRLSSDTAIASVLSTFFALGLLLISYLQRNPDDGQAGLSDFLFGKVAALSDQDVMLFGIIASLVLFIIRIRYFLMLGLVFDAAFMQLKGVSIRKNDGILNVLTMLTVAMGVQAVGVVLMSALLIIPVVGARMITFRFTHVLLLAAVISSVGTIVGASISLVAANLPTGPLIIVVLFLITLLIGFVKSIIYRLKK